MVGKMVGEGYEKSREESASEEGKRWTNEWWTEESKKCKRAFNELISKWPQIFGKQTKDEVIKEIATYIQLASEGFLTGNPFLYREAIHLAKEIGMNELAKDIARVGCQCCKARGIPEYGSYVDALKVAVAGDLEEETIKETAQEGFEYYLSAGYIFFAEECARLGNLGEEAKALLKKYGVEL